MMKEAWSGSLVSTQQRGLQVAVVPYTSFWLPFFFLTENMKVIIYHRCTHSYCFPVNCLAS